MDPLTYKSVLAILANYTQDEKEHWEATRFPDDHIYHHVRRLAAWASDIKPTA
jgi:hypothetical protein